VFLAHDRELEIRREAERLDHLLVRIGSGLIPGERLSSGLGSNLFDHARNNQPEELGDRCAESTSRDREDE